MSSPPQSVDVEDALHQHHLAAHVRAERGLEPGLDLEERGAPLSRCSSDFEYTLPDASMYSRNLSSYGHIVSCMYTTGSRSTPPPGTDARSRSAIGDHGNGTSTLPMAS